MFWECLINNPPPKVEHSSLFDCKEINSADLLIIDLISKLFIIKTVINYCL